MFNGQGRQWQKKMLLLSFLQLSILTGFSQCADVNRCKNNSGAQKILRDRAIN